MDEFVGAAGYNVSVHRSFLHIVCLTLIKVTTDKQIAPQKQLFDLFPGCNPDAKGLILPIFLFFPLLHFFFDFLHLFFFSFFLIFPLFFLSFSHVRFAFSAFPCLLFCGIVSYVER